MNLREEEGRWSGGGGRLVRRAAEGRRRRRGGGRRRVAAEREEGARLGGGHQTPQLLLQAERADATAGDGRCGRAGVVGVLAAVLDAVERRRARLAVVLVRRRHVRSFLPHPSSSKLFLALFLSLPWNLLGRKEDLVLALGPQHRGAS
ncbi:hypothetical protein PR202_ga01560 [Eleusine coracana subsp. coracana]|uniref:Uncharacterized protein n=1 Tax=Eleusine coracana subsp. coracana TaxID=191504 RepID=A0AAV5BGP1_ELECO|nr:hypothetical protein PR202_ga00873 [Eleusine coracana subsp. coracana]GJM85764.1 hypothetical protein PR202_ga01560 [Eleusine coracana subsp. coracana]